LPRHWITTLAGKFICTDSLWVDFHDGTVYRGDGISYDYQKGVYALTTLRCTEKDNGLIVAKSAPKGSYKIPERDHIVSVHKPMPVESVTVDDQPPARLGGREAFDLADRGWFNDSAKVVVLAKFRGGADRAVSIGFWNKVAK